MRCAECGLTIIRPVGPPEPYWGQGGHPWTHVIKNGDTLPLPEGHKARPEPLGLKVAEALKGDSDD